MHDIQNNIQFIYFLLVFFIFKKISFVPFVLCFFSHLLLGFWDLEQSFSLNHSLNFLELSFVEINVRKRLQKTRYFIRNQWITICYCAGNSFFFLYLFLWKRYGKIVLRNCKKTNWKEINMECNDDYYVWNVMSLPALYSSLTPHLQLQLHFSLTPLTTIHIININPSHKYIKKNWYISFLWIIKWNNNIHTP